MLETLISGTLWHVAKEISRSEPGKGGAVSLVQNTVCPQSIIRKLMVNRKVQTDPTLQTGPLGERQDCQLAGCAGDADIRDFVACCQRNIKV